MGTGRMNDCVNCKYANQSKNTRVIWTPAAVITQKQGGIVCENTGQKTIQIIDNGLRCSGFCRKEAKGGE